MAYEKLLNHCHFYGIRYSIAYAEDKGRWAQALILEKKRIPRIAEKIPFFSMFKRRSGFPPYTGITEPCFNYRA